MLAPDYQAQLQQLLPPGSAWTRGPLSWMTQLLGGLAPTYANVEARALNLLDEADPRTTLELLPDWERVAGLPDPCAGADQAIELRRQLLVAKLTQVGGQSAAYFEEQAFNVGYVVTISNFTVSDCEGTCEDPVREESWLFAFEVDGPATTDFVSTCEDTCEDPLDEVTNEVLECLINRLKPAHTVAIFIYGP